MFASRLPKHFLRRPLSIAHSPTAWKIPSDRSLGHSIRFTISRTFRHGAKDAGKKLEQTNVRRTKAFEVGRYVLGGGSMAGLGALCCYGLGVITPNDSINVNSAIWPDFIKQRIHATYQYFAGSLVLTSLAAYNAFRSPVLMTLVTRMGFLPVLGSLVVLIGAQAICFSVPYSPGFGIKQIAWIIHSVTVGTFLAPVCLMGGPYLVKAAWYTAGIVGGMSIVACCAPSNTFLYMAGPLAMGLGLVVASSIGSMFLPPTSGLVGASLYSISLYGGLFVMAAFIFFDTQRIVATAETHLDTIDNLYDPINMSISIYLATINIFVRIVALMAGGGGSQRK